MYTDQQQALIAAVQTYTVSPDPRPGHDGAYVVHRSGVTHPEDAAIFHTRDEAEARSYCSLQNATAVQEVLDADRDDGPAIPASMHVPTDAERATLPPSLAYYLAHVERELQRYQTDWPDLWGRNIRLQWAVDQAPDPRHFSILAEALAEIKATHDGESGQPIGAIIDGCLAEIAALDLRTGTTPAGWAKLVARWYAIAQTPVPTDRPVVIGAWVASNWHYQLNFGDRNAQTIKPFGRGSDVPATHWADIPLPPKP